MEGILAFVVEVPRYLGRHLLRTLQIKDDNEFLEIVSGMFIIIAALSLTGWLDRVCTYLRDRPRL